MVDFCHDPLTRKGTAAAHRAANKYGIDVSEIDRAKLRYDGRLGFDPRRHKQGSIPAL